jgi:hypothetical protein
MIFVFVGRNRPEDEWSGVLKKLDVPYHRFFDRNNSWYQDSSWPDEINRALDKHGAPRLSFGSSMGGWGALYHQPIIQAKKVIAFTPQTTTIPNEMRAIGGKKNNRWADGLEQLGHPGSRLPVSDRASDLYYGYNKKHPGQGDDGHKNIAKSLNYNIVNIDSTEHNLAGWLHEQDQLVDILKKGINQ